MFLGLLTSGIFSLVLSLTRGVKTRSVNVMGNANISALKCFNELDLPPVRANCCSKLKAK